MRKIIITVEVQAYSEGDESTLVLCGEDFCEVDGKNIVECMSRLPVFETITSAISVLDNILKKTKCNW